jgi:thymidine kinase
MFSGKTDTLIARYERARAEHRDVVAVKPARDGRHAPDRIISHSGREIPARSVSSLDEVGAHAVVLIDEIQFFDAELAGVVDAMRARGSDVVAVGLDRDFRRQPFETTAALACDADDVVRLAGTCSRCAADATLTQRLVDGRPAPLDAPRLVVGDADLYEPRCERCWAEERALARAGGT